MGNCGSAINCQQCYGRRIGCQKEIDVDPDLAGIGVIIAFFIATAITFSSIIFGYLTDSLPDSVLSDVDHYVIARLQTTFVVKRLFPWIGKLWLGLKSLFYRSIGKNPPSPRDSIPREQRIAALIRLLLGFSDQQLITGLAIFIAALANRCRLVAYELEILHSLAWFSATTHIATLTVLQEFFYANPVIRNWRVIGMSTFAGLLIFFEVITGLTESDIDKVDPATPIQCVIDGRIRPENLNAGNFLLNVYYLFMFFLPMYIINVIDLFIDPRFTGGPFAYLYLSLNLRRRKVKGEDRRRSLINSSIQKDTILSRDVFSGPSFLVASLSRYATSFLSFFTVIPFFLVYNFINTTMVTWFWGIKTTDKIREMGFGQVVALALLAIPILTATEIYNEAREPLQGHQEATGSSEIQNNEDQGSDNDSSTQVSMANSQHSKPPDQRADFLQVVFQDIQQDYGHYNLEARRIAFLSVSIGMLKLKSIKLNRIRQPMGPDQRTFRLTVEILFLLDLGAGLFIAVSLSELPLPYGVTIAGMVLYGLYVCVATVVLFFNYILQRQLILSQLMARDTMPKSDEGWNGLFRYLSSQTERSSSQASLQSALSRSDSIPVNEAGEDELESNLGSVRRRHTGWALENQSGESIA